MRTLKPNLLDQLPVQRLQKVRGQQGSPAVQTVLPSTDVPLCSVGGRKFRAAHCFNRTEEEERRASLAALCLIEFTFDFNSRVWNLFCRKWCATGGGGNPATSQSSAGINIIKTSATPDQDRTKLRRPEGGFQRR